MVMIKLKDIVNEQLKKSYANLLKRFFTGYTGSRQGKSSLEALYKVKNKSPFSDIIKMHKISKGPYYRGMELDKVPKKGDTFKFRFGGWSTRKEKGMFYGRFADTQVVFIKKNSKHAFLDAKGLGNSIVRYIEKHHPDWEEKQDYPHINYELSDLMSFAKRGGAFGNEGEVVFEPHNAKVKKVFKKDNVYFVEVE